MKISEILNETTTSGNIASISGGWGGPTQMWRSIYPKKKHSKKKDNIIRRIPKNEE